MQIAKCLGQFWQKIWRKINLQHAESKSDTSTKLQKVEKHKTNYLNKSNTFPYPCRNGADPGP